MSRCSVSDFRYYYLTPLVHCAGPGLGVRVLGDVTEGDALDVLRNVRSPVTHLSHANDVAQPYLYWKNPSQYCEILDMDHENRRFPCDPCLLMYLANDAFEDTACPE